jgi:hypothetical protein
VVDRRAFLREQFVREVIEPLDKHLAGLRSVDISELGLESRLSFGENVARIAEHLRGLKQKWGVK